MGWVNWGEIGEIGSHAYMSTRRRGANVFNLYFILKYLLSIERKIKINLLDRPQ